MEIGIIGLPSSGKTTLLNALTHAHAATGAYAGGRPNLGVIKVPDPRLEALAACIRPQRVVQAELSFVDVPGQPPELGRSQGFQGEYLLQASQADALLLVLRAYRSPALPDPDPERDLATMDMEMAFADLAVIERRLQRLESSTKGARPPEREAIGREVTLLGELKAALEGGSPLRSVEPSAEARKALSGFTFLTTKPLIVLLNIDEAQVAQAEDLGHAWQEQHGSPSTACMALCARLEEELAQLEPPEAQEFRTSLGAPEEPPTGAFVRLVQQTAGLATFYTAASNEARAWQMPLGTPAPRAAGKIHTDMERGFIRAEVIALPDLLRVGGFQEARHQGLLRHEGKGYVLQDGDVVTFLFNVSR